MKKRVKFNDIVEIKYFNKNEPITNKKSNNNYIFKAIAISLLIIVIINLLL